MKDTQRFELRTLRVEDAEQMYALAKEKEVGYNCGWKPHDDLEETKTILEKFLINEHTWGIVDKETKALYGVISLDEDRKRKCVGYRELGYWIGKPYWGKGVMVEVANEILRYGFEDLELKMISVSHFSFNQRSQRVIEKLGFKYEGCIRETFAHYTNTRLDEMSYSLKKEEWEENN